MHACWWNSKGVEIVWGVRGGKLNLCLNCYRLEKATQREAITDDPDGWCAKPEIQLVIPTSQVLWTTTIICPLNPSTTLPSLDAPCLHVRHPHPKRWKKSTTTDTTEGCEGGKCVRQLTKKSLQTSLRAQRAELGMIIKSPLERRKPKSFKRDIAMARKRRKKRRAGVEMS